MSSAEQHNPEWLSKAVFNDSFDWSKSITTTFQTFFEFVTLHDSRWETVTLNPTNETILLIELDAFWNKKYTLKFREDDTWPYLIFKIPNVINISYNTIDFATTIVESSCITIDSIQIEELVGVLSETTIFPKELSSRLIKFKEVHKTRFNDVYGGNIEILHSPEILVLLIDRNGTYIDPTLDKACPSHMKRNTVKTEEKGLLKKLWNKLIR
jgi:hypothetical protein